MRKSGWMAVLALALAGLLWGCRSLPEQMAGKFSVHKVYGDHMVLQRQKPVQISGHAAPGEAVKVAIAPETGSAKEIAAYATADAQGEWEAVLPEMEAGGPYTVTVSGKEGSTPIVFRDVLIGEVWLCSGQSNMEMPVFSGRKHWNSMNGQAEAAAANDSKLRLYNSNLRKKVSPGVVQHEVDGPGWKIATPDVVAPFSAAGYYFGRQLRKDLDVPVGLINASWGGTPIESWISEEGYQLAGRSKELDRINAVRGEKGDGIEEQIRNAEAKQKRAFSDWEARFYGSDPAATAAAKAWKEPGFDDGNWASVKYPAVFPENVDGVIWYRVAVDLPDAWAGKDLTLDLGAIDDCDETYFNGVQVGAIGTKTANYWQTERKYKVPGKLVKAGRNVIAVRVSDMYGGGGFMAPAPALRNGGESVTLADKTWKSKMEFQADLKKIGARPDPTGSTNVGVRSPHFPSTLYNSMIAPWTVYPIRGAIWYQGESNSGRYEDYMILQPLLINDWRRLWDDPELAFVLTQLAAYQQHRPDRPLKDDFWKELPPGDNNWSKLREVQTATLALPNTGMAVCIDRGNHSDIHPADKQAVGYRLATEAERICYGRTEVSAGPLYKAMKIEGDKIRISFDNVGSGLVAEGGKPTSFAIAGKDGKFVWADAKIDGDTVLVWSDQVKDPIAVRYAWAMYPADANLFNKEGFPASPFRTDQPDYLLYR